MAFVGYIQTVDGDFQVAAAGLTYDEAFTRTFTRAAPMVSAFGAPDMAVQEKAITDDEAHELEAICAKHLGKA